MGIKFHCPNGHKLNVKAFLAGKKGVCPKCGTRLRIPTASEQGLGDDGDDSETERPAETIGGNGAAVKAALAAAAAAPLRSAPAPLPVPATVPAAAQPAAAPAVPVPMPTPAAFPSAPAPAAAPAEADPITEAPLAVWYVRPPSGGQFGPARGEIMRKWMSEGRVSSDSLVWREGWAEWQNAGKVFPHLQAAAVPATPAVSAAATATPRPSPALNRYQAKKGRGNGMGVALLVGLAVVCVVLVAVLGYVLFNMSR